MKLSLIVARPSNAALIGIRANCDGHADTETSSAARARASCGGDCAKVTSTATAIADSARPMTKITS